MISSGKPEESSSAGKPGTPTVVIIAEITFAALLLYLTNHPLELDDLTQAQLQIEEPLNQELRPVILETVNPADQEQPPAVAVVATSISSTTESLVSN